MKQTNCHNQGWLVGEGDPIQPTFIQNSALVDASSLWPCTKGGGGGGGGGFVVGGGVWRRIHVPFFFSHF